MQYIKSSKLDHLDDESFVFVNRNILNSTIAKYEMDVKHVNNNDELGILLSIWNKTYETERKTKRIEVFIKMTTKDVKKCFKDYKLLPIGSFGINKN